jgi:hypothetical protein
MSRIRRISTHGGLIMMLLWGAAPRSLGVEISEEHIKASFLLNLTRHVEWPPESFKDDTSPLVVGILGSDPIGAALFTLLSGKSAAQRPLDVRMHDGKTIEPSRLKESHILFICPSMRGRWKEILAGLGNAPVLTVADTGPFTREGGMVNLILEDARVRMDVNKGNFIRARLQMSEQMSKAAHFIQ